MGKEHPTCSDCKKEFRKLSGLDLYASNTPCGRNADAVEDSGASTVEEKAALAKVAVEDMTALEQHLADGRRDGSRTDTDCRLDSSPNCPRRSTPVHDPVHGAIIRI